MPIEKKVQILQLLVEGNSMRSIERIVGCSINTVTKLLEDAGVACAAYHNENVRGVTKSDHSAMPKQRTWPPLLLHPKARGAWTWMAIDADSKLIISYMVGGRDAGYALALTDDLRSRLELERNRYAYTLTRR